MLSQCPDRSASLSVALPPILFLSGPSSYWIRGAVIRMMAPWTGEPSSPALMSLALPDLMHLFGWDQFRGWSVPQSLRWTCCTCSAQVSLWMITYFYMTWQLHVHTCLLNMIITSAIVIFYGLLQFFLTLWPDNLKITLRLSVWAQTASSFQQWPIQMNISSKRAAWWEQT